MSNNCKSLIADVLDLDEINKLGSKGWELACVRFFEGRCYQYYYFRSGFKFEYCVRYQMEIMLEDDLNDLINSGTGAWELVYFYHDTRSANFVYLMKREIVPFDDVQP